MYAPSRLDGELEPEEDADDFEEFALDPEELSELACEVELFEHPVAASATIETTTRMTRTIDMSLYSRRAVD